MPLLVFVTVLNADRTHFEILENGSPKVLNVPKYVNSLINTSFNKSSLLRNEYTSPKPVVDLFKVRINKVLPKDLAKCQLYVN